MDEEKGLTRRKFLSAVTFGIGGALAAFIGIPGIIYVVEPALVQQNGADWMRLGPTSKVKPGTPTLFSVKVDRQTGWITNQVEIMMYLYTEDGRNYTAMSNVCTHLGCRVRWIEDRQQFYCPCHNGIYDRQGQVLAGPPPRPLDQFPVNIKDNDIYVNINKS